jgi:hypothetical protein
MIMFNVLTLNGSPLVASDGTEGPVQGLFARLSAWASREPRTSDDLLELAATYEATQPSYAADLRAAAALVQIN